MTGIGLEYKKGQLGCVGRLHKGQSRLCNLPISVVGWSFWNTNYRRNVFKEKANEN